MLVLTFLSRPDSWLLFLGLCHRDLALFLFVREELGDELVFSEVLFLAGEVDIGLLWHVDGLDFAVVVDGDVVSGFLSRTILQRKLGLGRDLQHRLVCFFNRNNAL